MDAEGLKASTIASAIEINRPVNLKKCLRARLLRRRGPPGLRPGDHGRQGPSRSRRPGLRARERRERRRRPEAPRGGGDRPQRSVVCILTGHLLKDPTATVAYHGTDQDNFDKVLGSRGVRRPASPTDRSASPTTSTTSSARSPSIPSRGIDNLVRQPGQES